MQILLTEEEFERTKNIEEQYNKLCLFLGANITMEYRQGSLYGQGLIYSYHKPEISKIVMTIDIKELFKLLEITVDENVPIEVRAK